MACKARILRFRIPPILSAEHVFAVVMFCFRLGELACPGDSRGGGGTRPGVFELGVESRFFCLRFFPVVPAFGSHYLGHLSIQKNCLRVVSPGPPQESFDLRYAAGNPALVEYEPEWLVVRGGGRGYVAISQALNVAFLKKCSRAPENEI